MNGRATRTALVAGAGIGGTAAALALRRAGFKVRVLERASGLTEVGAGIGLNPNAVGALTKLGVSSRLKATAVAPQLSLRRRWQDGRELARIDLTTTEKRYGFPFWFSHRVNLLTAIADEALDPSAPGEPITIDFGVQVLGYDRDSGRVRTDKLGELAADLIVAADGIGSVLRYDLFSTIKPVYGGQTHCRTQVLMADIVDDPELQEFSRPSNFESWLGPGSHVVHCKFKAGEVMNLGIALTAPPIGPGLRTGPIDPEEVFAILDGWYPPLRKLLRHGLSYTRYDSYELPPLESWVEGNVCLLGDAAHPMVPYLGQGAAQAIEDAEALGAALDGVGSNDIPAALKLYETLRRERATKVQAVSAGNRHIYHLADGPEQEQRDQRIAAAASDVDVTQWLWQYSDPAKQVEDLIATRNKRTLRG